MTYLVGGAVVMVEDVHQNACCPWYLLAIAQELVHVSFSIGVARELVRVNFSIGIALELVHVNFIVSLALELSACFHHIC